MRTLRLRPWILSILSRCFPRFFAWRPRPIRRRVPPPRPFRPLLEVLPARDPPTSLFGTDPMTAQLAVLGSLALAAADTPVNRSVAGTVTVPDDDSASISTPLHLSSTAGWEVGWSPRKAFAGNWDEPLTQTLQVSPAVTDQVFAINWQPLPNLNDLFRDPLSGDPSAKPPPLAPALPGLGGPGGGIGAGGGSNGQGSLGTSATAGAGDSGAASGGGGVPAGSAADLANSVLSAGSPSPGGPTSAASSSVVSSTSLQTDTLPATSTMAALVPSTPTERAPASNGRLFAGPQQTTTTDLGSSANPATVGAAVTLTATVPTSSSHPSTGSVTFKDGTTTLGTVNVNSSGQAAYTTSSLTVGSHTITATYNPGVGYLGSSTTLTQTINTIGTSTALASNLDPSSVAQTVTFTATVTPASGSGTPAGTVTFKDGSTTLGSGTLNGSGQASFSTSALALGSHSITAVYAANGNYGGSTSPVLTQTVNQIGTTTTLGTSPNPSNFNQTVTLTATVTANSSGGGTLAGSVTFKDGSTSLGSVSLNSSGQASLTISTLTPGSHVLTAVYGGSGNFAGSTSVTYSQTVNNLVPTLTSLNVTAAVEGCAAVTITATGTHFATNSVLKWNGGGLATTFVSATQLQATIPAALLAEEGTFTVVVFTPTPGGGTSSAITFTVSDAALSGAAAAISPTEATSFTGVVATFTDADPNGTASDYTATITWGDGQSSSGTIAANGSGGFTVTGTHTYNAPGSFTFSVQVVDAGGSSLTVSRTITVTVAPLTATGIAVTAFEGTAFSGLVATFTDGHPSANLSDYSATITWGDGHTSAGTIGTGSGGSFTVSGTNTYAEEGSFAVQVSITKVTSSSASASSTATVADAALTATLAAFSPTEVTAFSGVVGSFTDADSNGTASDYTAIITWGDGHTSTGTVVANGSGGFNVRGARAGSPQESPPGAPTRPDLPN